MFKLLFISVIPSSYLLLLLWQPYLCLADFYNSSLALTVLLFLYNWKFNFLWHIISLVIFISLDVVIDQAAANNEPIKRQRRWNSEGLKVPEPQSTNSTPNTTPKDAFQTTPKDAFQTTPKDSFQSSGLKRNFSRSDSTNSDNTPKERVGKSSLFSN